MAFNDKYSQQPYKLTFNTLTASLDSDNALLHDLICLNTAESIYLVGRAVKICSFNFY